MPTTPVYGGVLATARRIQAGRQPGRWQQRPTSPTSPPLSPGAEAEEQAGTEAEEAGGGRDDEGPTTAAAAAGAGPQPARQATEGEAKAEMGRRHGASATGRKYAWSRRRQVMSVSFVVLSVSPLDRFHVAVLTVRR